MAEIFDTPKGPITVNDRYYLASCDKCGWIGSSEHCGTDCWGDDSDVYCPECHAAGADGGKVAAKIEAEAVRARRKARPSPAPKDGGAET